MKKEDVIVLANLSALHFNDAELEKMLFDLNDLDEYISDIEIMKTSSEIFDFQITDLDDLREDIVEDSLTQEESLANAVDSNNGFIQLARRKRDGK